MAEGAVQVLNVFLVILASNKDVILYTRHMI